MIKNTLLTNLIEANKKLTTLINNSESNKDIEKQKLIDELNDVIRLVDGVVEKLEQA